VSDESLLEEMRAAVRGDRQRAEKRRAAGSPQPATEAVEPELEEPPAGTGDSEKKDVWFRRVTRRRRAT
jgi:hypothetical protein